jgi:glycosyltransferase involved in cell wall biosynthesis
VRILHLVDRLTERGGAYRHLLGMLEWLADGHEQLVAYGERAGEARIGCEAVRARGLRSRVRAPIGLDRLVTQFSPDVVHLHTVMNPAVIEWAACQRTVMTVQDHRLFCPGRGKLTMDERVCRTTMDVEVCRGCFEEAGYGESMLALTRERLAAAGRLTRLTVLSHYMKDELVAAGTPAEQVEVIPSFVHDLDHEALPDGPQCVLFVGRLVWAKGVRDAIAAWRQADLDLPLVFAGAGPFAQEAQAAGFEVLGWLDRARLSRAFKRARALLLPSRWQEPFGIVGLEALAMGVPVVAYDSGGIREWHPGPDEGLVPWGDVAALAAALRTAVHRRAGGRAGFEREALMRRLVGLYEVVRG